MMTEGNEVSYSVVSRGTTLFFALLSRLSLSDIVRTEQSFCIKVYRLNQECVGSKVKVVDIESCESTARCFVFITTSCFMPYP